MRILHTSDWHLGRMLYGRKRDDEFQSMLDWMVATIEQQQVALLIIAGDIFDTTTPSNRAQAMYYRFLCRIAALACCRHVVVVAGNHDSPSFLDAPREILRHLQIHVLGNVAAARQDQLLLLTDAQHQPELLLCAVPYLRDRDIRQSVAGESIQDKEQKLQQGIAEHYKQLVALAQQRNAELEQPVPLVATGHLFAAGGQTVEGDGVRELYVGSLARVPVSVFPDSVDYVALGHLHVPQQVAGCEHIRYSGSPLAMGFGEAAQRKQVLLVDCRPGQLTVEPLTVPVFQPLAQIKGDWPTLEAAIRVQLARDEAVWLEVIYQGDELIDDLRQRLQALLADSPLEILRIQNRRIMQQTLAQLDEVESLADLDERAVFEHCLDSHAVTEEQRVLLQHSYQELLHEMQQQDKAAE